MNRRKFLQITSSLPLLSLATPDVIADTLLSSTVTDKSTNSGLFITRINFSSHYTPVSLRLFSDKKNLYLSVKRSLEVKQ